MYLFPAYVLRQWLLKSSWNEARLEPRSRSRMTTFKLFWRTFRVLRGQSGPLISERRLNSLIPRNDRSASCRLGRGRRVSKRRLVRVAGRLVDDFDGLLKVLTVRIPSSNTRSPSGPVLQSACRELASEVGVGARSPEGSSLPAHGSGLPIVVLSCLLLISSSQCRGDSCSLPLTKSTSLMEY